MAAYGLPFFCAFSCRVSSRPERFFSRGCVSGKINYISLTKHINNVKNRSKRYYNTILLLLLILLIFIYTLYPCNILYIVFLFAKKNNK